MGGIMKSSTDVVQFELGTKVLIRNHKAKYHSDYDWGIIQQSPSQGKIDVKMGDRFHIAVDITDIFLGETPEFKINGVYLHSSGKQATIVKLFKSVPKAEVFFKGCFEKQKVNLSDLSFIQQPNPAEQPQLFNLDDFTQPKIKIIGDSAWDDGSAFPDISLTNSENVSKKSDGRSRSVSAGLSPAFGDSERAACALHSALLPADRINSKTDSDIFLRESPGLSLKNENSDCREGDALTINSEISLKNENSDCPEGDRAKDIKISLKNENSDCQEGDDLTINSEISLKNENSGFQEGDRKLIELGLRTDANSGNTPSKFVRENTIEAMPSAYRQNESSALAERLEESVAIASSIPTKFVRENATSPKKIANGSLAPFLENKKLKSGQIVTYPRVEGARDKLNYSHWRWGYYHEVKIDGEWRNRSIPVPAKIAPLVRQMIDRNYSVEQIKEFILQCKNKKQENVL